MLPKASKSSRTLIARPPRRRPGSPFGRRGRAQAGDLETAKKLAALEKYPALAPQVRLLNASFLCKEGKHEEAKPLIERELRDAAMRPLALVVAGESLFGQGKFLAAEPLFQEVLRSNPQSVDAHRWLSIIYYDLGAIDYANFHLRQLAELDPQDYRACRLLGLINKDFEVFDEAVRQYRESLRRSPDQPPRQEVLGELAECLVQCRLPRRPQDARTVRTVVRRGRAEGRMSV